MRPLGAAKSLGSKRDLKTHPIGPRPKDKKSSRNAPAFDLRTELYRITGIDWAQINGIDVLTAQTVIAEAGSDLSAFPSEKQFASWLGLCPTNEQSGGKILNRRTRKVVNRGYQNQIRIYEAHRFAADYVYLRSKHRCRSWFGAWFRDSPALPAPLPSALRD